MCSYRLATIVAALAMAGSSGAWADDFSYFDAKPCSLSRLVVNNVLGQLASVVSLAMGGCSTQ